MILGSKPLAEMSEAELQAAIAELQESREALRAEMIAKAKAKRDGGPTPKATPKSKSPKAIDPFEAGILAILRGEVKK